MKADALFVITMIIFIFVAWVATGGPSRPIASAGPWITPITRSGEQSQGYRITAPPNPISTNAYPRQIGHAQTISRGPSSGNGSGVMLVHSILGALSANPNQEYMSLINNGNATTSTTGWTVSSKANGSTITLPRFSLPPKGQETVVTGRPGQVSVCEHGVYCVFLNRSLEVYASSKDTITLKDAGGTVVDTYSY